MIVKETDPVYIYTRKYTDCGPYIHKYLDLSDEEKVRLKEILEELKIMFNADSIDVVSKGGPVSPKCDYEIRIHNGDTVNYIFK